MRRIKVGDVSFPEKNPWAHARSAVPASTTLEQSLDETRVVGSFHPVSEKAVLSIGRAANPSHLVWSRCLRPAKCLKTNMRSPQLDLCQAETQQTHPWSVSDDGHTFL
jgi:hypothetical protein